MELAPFSLPSNEAHGIPFWRVVFRDVLMSFTLLLLGTAFLAQMIAIAGGFWARAYFGSRFDPEVYSTFAAEKSNASVVSTFGLEKALVARRAANAPVEDDVTRTMDKAGEELEQTRVRREEFSQVRKEAERQADAWIQQAKTAWKNHLPDVAYRNLQNSLEVAPDYLPAIKELALFHERQHDFAQARFQWERAAGLALPQSMEMEEVQQNLVRINRRYAEILRNQEPLPTPVTVFRIATPNSFGAPPPPNVITVNRVTQKNLPLEDLYDLCFYLRIVLGSQGAEPRVDIRHARVEVDFFDQSHSAGGVLIPIKVKNITLQPKETWMTGKEQILTLRYALPRGYLRGKAQVFGTSYSFCGYVMRVYYRGQLQDTYANPANILKKYVKACPMGHAFKDNVVAES